MRTLVLMAVLAGCGKKTPAASETVAYTLHGTITLANPTTSNVSDSQLTGGNISVVLFANNSAGYCLTGADAVAAEGLNQVAAPSVDQLQSGGIAYTLEVMEIPGQTYPITVYPAAVLLNSDSFAISCVQAAGGGAPQYSARAYYGVKDQATATAQNRSACCAFVPSALVITAPKSEIENVDFVLTPATADPASCTPSQKPFDKCALRHDDQGGDSACWVSLGTAAANVITQVGGSACP